MRILNKELGKTHIFGLVAALLIIVLSLISYFFFDFLRKEILWFIIGISVVIAGTPFFMSLIISGRREEGKEEMFLEFSRDLVQGARSGTPISKSILNLRGKNYGPLTTYVDKLTNQIALGIPVRIALGNFAADLESPVISRAITLIMEAERAGGKIETILESVASSVSQIEKLRKERKAAIYNLTVQGYIVFLIFIVIMIVMQFKILPITADLAIPVDSPDVLSIGGPFGKLGSTGVDPDQLALTFLYLLLMAGLLFLSLLFLSCLFCLNLQLKKCLKRKFLFL